MGWGGGFGGGGGFVGSHSSAQQSGLPFGGIPTELQLGVDKILATEPKLIVTDQSIASLRSGGDLRFCSSPSFRKRARRPGRHNLWWVAGLRGL